jgi:hypothetical protein
MSMGSDTKMDSGMNMDMDSGGDTDAAIAPAQAAMNHTMFKLDFARNPIEPTAQLASGPRVPFGNVTSCAEEACVHVSVSSSPPNAYGLRIHGLFLAATSISVRAVLLGFGLTEEFDTSPPKVLPADRLVALRI